MTERQRLAREGMRAALTLRRSQRIELNRPVQVYDLVDSLGIELRFLDVPSMEGLYYKEARPAIIVSSLRPRGRRVFTCAHELGHHVFGHGTRADELLAQPDRIGAFKPEEYLADSFARGLLMPKAAVDWAFRSRGWTPGQCTPLQVYVVAGWLDVGYETLVRQLEGGLHMLTRPRMEGLLRSTPQRIRADVLGFDHDGDLLIADVRWCGRAIDIEVGDLIALPADAAIEGECVEVVRADGNMTLLRGVKPGRGRAMTRDGHWAAFIRVSRRGYVGRGIFRHLEDPADAE